MCVGERERERDVNKRVTLSSNLERERATPEGMFRERERATPRAQARVLRCVGEREREQAR